MVGEYMNIVFMGTPNFSVPVLTKLNQHHHIMLVVTQPDKAVGRKKTMMASPVKEKALELGLPVFQPASLRKDYQMIIDLKPDLIVTAAYGQMLPQDLLNQFEAINVHGSLLPHYRGGAPIQYALFDGLKETGITIMYMAYKMDSGDIISQQKVSIENDDNYGTLSKKLSIIGADLLIQVLDDITQGKKQRTPQNEQDVTFAYTIKPSDEEIHFGMTTDQMIHRIRGLSPEPGATLNLKNTTLKVYRAQKGDIIDDKAIPGCVLTTHKRLIIKTIDGSIEFLEVQQPGKKVMATKDFLNGQNIIKQGDVIEGRK